MSGGRDDGRREAVVHFLIGVLERPSCVSATDDVALPLHPVALAHVQGGEDWSIGGGERSIVCGSCSTDEGGGGRIAGGRAKSLASWDRRFSGDYFFA